MLTPWLRPVRVICFHSGEGSQLAGHLVASWGTLSDTGCRGAGFYNPHLPGPYNNTVEVAACIQGRKGHHGLSRACVPIMCWV